MVKDEPPEDIEKIIEQSGIVIANPGEQIEISKEDFYFSLYNLAKDYGSKAQEYENRIAEVQQIFM